MFKKRFSKFMSAGLIAGLLAVASVPTVFAASMPERAGYSAATAAAPDSAVHTLQPGQWDWYVFKSQVPPLHGLTQSQRLAQDTAKIDVTMNVQQGQGNFEIWNAQTLRDWTSNVKYTAFGQGTENDALRSDPMHFWQGSFTVNGTYYLVVKNKGNTPMNYALNITDKNVSFPSNLMIKNIQ
ncbi:MAG: hypothetical protein KDE46_08785 [Caldilineaceae bacterium]|nr:hypothetical protein [Caldilineaceae bacterium]